MEEFKRGRIPSVDRVKENYKMIRNSGSSSSGKLLSLLELERHAEGAVRIKQELHLQKMTTGWYSQTWVKEQRHWHVGRTVINNPTYLRIIVTPVTSSCCVNLTISRGHMTSRQCHIQKSNAKDAEQRTDPEKQKDTQNTSLLSFTASILNLCPNEKFFLQIPKTEFYQQLYHYAVISIHIYSCYGLNCVPSPSQNILKP